MPQPHYKTLIRRAEWFLAYDSAMEHLTAHPHDRDAQHAAVLCLVRGGALETAQRLYDRFGLKNSGGNEDLISLGGRLFKDLATQSHGHAAKAHLETARGLYARAYALSGGAYSGINTATLSWLCGDKAAAKGLARNILEIPQPKNFAKPDDAYYFHATRAEAHLLCEDRPACIRAFDYAIAADPLNYAAQASTLHQLEKLIIAGAPAIDFTRHRPPSVIHYCGHIFGKGAKRAISEKRIKALKTKVDEALVSYNIGCGYGALAAGCDILIAESLLERGADLYVVLPVPVDIFKRLSVTPYGQDWQKRFDACLKSATSVTITNNEASDFDDLDLSIGSRVAMGKACLRAKALTSKAIQLAIWDGIPADIAGTGADYAIWQQAGRAQITLNWPAATPLLPKPNAHASSPYKRQMSAMIFADLVGFSRLPDAAQPEVTQAVLRPLAECLRTLEVSPHIIDSWGDGIFLVFDTPQSAAKAALALQIKFEMIAPNLPAPLSDLALRIGGHYGPVYAGLDPFRECGTIYGRNVVTASRIESLTLPGSIFISEPMACSLEAFHAPRFSCEYVGVMTPQKNHPSLPLFSLRANPNCKK